MKILEVEPRTPKWHEIRSESWTASAAAVLVAKPNAILLRDYAASKGVTLDIDPLLEVGLDSYFDNTLWKAWAEKVGRIPRFEGNAHTERGTSYEGLVVRTFEEDKMLVVEKDVTALSSIHPGLLASFDAMAPASSDTTVSAPYGFPVEAKCPAFHSRKKLWDSRKAGNLAIMGLPYYWCQVQHQILVAEAPYGWFVAAGVDKDSETGVEKVVFPLIEQVPRDDRFLKAYTAAANFYHQTFVEGYIEPPMLPSDEALLTSLAEKARIDKALVDADHDMAVMLYLDAVHLEAEASQRRKALEERVAAAANAMRAEGADMVMLTDRLQVCYTTTESVSWQKVAKELATKAGLTEIPKEVVEACKNKSKESVKFKEVT